MTKWIGLALCLLPLAPEAADQPLGAVLIAAEAVDGNYGGNCYGLSAVRFVVRPD